MKITQEFFMLTMLLRIVTVFSGHPVDMSLSLSLTIEESVVESLFAFQILELSYLLYNKYFQQQNAKLKRVLNLIVKFYYFNQLFALHCCTLPY